jgi:hypothetical protein
LVCQNTYAAGAVCFNYEAFKHPMPPAPVNQALVNYDYQMIQAQNAVIPALAIGVHQLGVSLMRVGGAAIIPWQHVIVPPLGAALNLQYVLGPFLVRV